MYIMFICVCVCVTVSWFSTFYIHNPCELLIYRIYIVFYVCMYVYRYICTYRRVHYTNPFPPTTTMTTTAIKILATAVVDSLALLYNNIIFEQCIEYNLAYTLYIQRRFRIYYFNQPFAAVGVQLFWIRRTPIDICYKSFSFRHPPRMLSYFQPSLSRGRRASSVVYCSVCVVFIIFNMAQDKKKKKV